MNESRDTWLELGRRETCKVGLLWDTGECEANSHGGTQENKHPSWSPPPAAPQGRTHLDTEDNGAALLTHSSSSPHSISLNVPRQPSTHHPEVILYCNKDQQWRVLWMGVNHPRIYQRAHHTCCWTGVKKHRVRIDEKNYEKMPHMCVENSRNPNFTVFLWTVIIGKERCNRPSDATKYGLRK